jgi:hypothetical protein
MKKLLIIIAIVAVIAAVAGFNQWFQRKGIVELHTEMAKSVRQDLVNRGIRPISWEILKGTRGKFETVPDYPAEVKELEGKQITIVGYGTPLGDGNVAQSGHSHASMLPLPTLEMLLGHVHTVRYKGVPELMLTPLPLECIWGKYPPLNQAMYVRTREPVGFADGAAIAVTGILELRAQEGPKFFYVLKDAELIK